MQVETSVDVPTAPVRLSRRAEWTRKQAISYLMQQAVENPAVISLAAGLVDRDTLPVEEARAAVAEILRDEEQGRDVDRAKMGGFGRCFSRVLPALHLRTPALGSLAIWL